MRLFVVAFLISLTLGVSLGHASEAGDPLEAQRMSVLFTQQSQQTSIWVRCAFSVRQDMVLNFRVRPSENSIINSWETRLVDRSTDFNEKTASSGERVHVNGDDATPWHINGTYIGGNHGCTSVRELTVPEGALSVADIGSGWKDEAGTTFYIIDVPAPGLARVMSENLAPYPFWKFNTQIVGATLTRIGGDSTVTFTQSKLTQLWPCARIKEQKFLANGKTPLTPDKALDCEYLDLVEEYDIINPASLLAHIIAHPGQKADYIAPHLDAVIHNRIVYRVSPNAATTITHEARALQPFNLEFMGFIQQALLSADPASSGLIRYYIPKAVPFQQDGIDYDFRSIQTFETPKSGLKFTGHDTVGNRTLPERFVQFLAEAGTAKNQNRLGLAFGYSLTSGLTAVENPSWQRNSAGFIHTTAKSYPFALDDTIQNPVAPGTVFECVAYRQYFNPALQANATCVFWHRENAQTIVYIDYHKAVSGDIIHLPKTLAGRPFRILEKTASLTVDSGAKIPREGLKITSDSEQASLVIAIADEH